MPVVADAGDGVEEDRPEISLQVIEAWPFASFPAGALGELQFAKTHEAASYSSPKQSSPADHKANGERSALQKLA